MKHWEWTLLAAFLLSLWISCFSAFAAECDIVRHDTLRLHILANSDTEADQQLKLMVRDQILEETSAVFSHTASRSEAIAAAQQALPQMLQAAQKLLAQQGYDYEVTGDVIPLYFNTRQYDQVILPAGIYDAVQIRIGKAEGQNWWCVLFPPLCVSAAIADSGQAQLPSQAASDTMEEISELSVEYVPKFAAVEWIEGIMEKIRG